MGPEARKPVFRGLRITLAQTSRRIRAVRSEPLLFAFWKVSYLGLLQAKFLDSLCSWGDWFKPWFFKNPEDRFCRVKAQIYIVNSLPTGDNFCYLLMTYTNIFGPYQNRKLKLLKEFVEIVQFEVKKSADVKRMPKNTECKELTQTKSTQKSNRWSKLSSHVWCVPN